MTQSPHAIFFALVLTAVSVHGQTLATSNAPPVAAEETADKSWSFFASAYAYFVPDSREYVQPTFTADRDWLHLEMRYNYEALETGSAWLGYKFGDVEKRAWELTPMLGGVFGNTTGIAPGYKGSLRLGKLKLSSEGGFVLDTGDISKSFFYNWSELTLAPAEWFRFGLVTQRTRTYQAERDIQRGLLIGFTCKQLDLSTILFNLDASQPTVVVAVGLSF